MLSSEMLNSPFFLISTLLLMLTEWPICPAATSVVKTAVMPPADAPFAFIRVQRLNCTSLHPGLR